MNHNCEVIVFKVHRDTDGLFTAISPQMSGVFVAHRDLDKIVEDMPNIIRLWFKRNRNVDIQVFHGPVEQQDDDVTAYSAMYGPARPRNEPWLVQGIGRTTYYRRLRATL